MPRFEYVCQLEEVSEDRAQAFEVGDRRFALVRRGDRCYAVSDRCPHAGGDLARGWIEDGELVCPLHRWHFQPADGRCTTIRGEWVRTYPCETRDGDVWIELD